jgi:hypothetical protein
MVMKTHFRLGHREGRADLAIEQRLEPARLDLVGAVARDGLHVAGVGGRAIEHLGGPGHGAHDLGQRRVFLVGQARALVAGGVGGVDRQEQVPQAGGARLGLELLDHRQRAPALAGVRVGLQLLLVGLLVGIDVVVHEALHARLQVPGLGGVFEIHCCSPS